MEGRLLGIMLFQFTFSFLPNGLSAKTAFLKGLPRPKLSGLNVSKDNLTLYIFKLDYLDLTI